MSELAISLERVSRFPFKTNVRGGKKAVVAIAVEDASPEPTFVLTLRSGRLRTHAAQYALPGGKVDPGESLEEALFREVAEEIGDLRWELVGRLDDYVTESGFTITPFVLLHKTGIAALHPNPDEIDKIFRVPIPTSYEWSLNGSHKLSEGGMQISFGAFDMFPPTGAIILQFLETWVHGRHIPVAHLRAPRFARK